jgi:hypothetical protein
MFRIGGASPAKAGFYAEACPLPTIEFRTALPIANVAGKMDVM